MYFSLSSNRLKMRKKSKSFEEIQNDIKEFYQNKHLIKDYSIDNDSNESSESVSSGNFNLLNERKFTFIFRRKRLE